MSEDETGGGSEGGSGGGGGRGPGREVGGVAKGVEGVTEGIAAIIPGEDSEGEEALETVGDVAGAVSKGAEGIDKLASGAQSGNVSNLGAGVGGIADAARYVVPEGEAREVLAGVGQVARGAGQLIEGVRGVADRLGGLGSDGEGGGGGSSNVRYNVEVEGVDATLTVRSLHFEDSIGSLTMVSLEATCERDTVFEETELFGKDVHVSIDRGEEQRSLRGMIRRSSVHQGQEEQVVHMEVVPALWMLTQTADSRVYQDLSVPVLVEKMFEEYLEAEHRTVRLELTETYLPHEYLVQHNESHVTFISRLLSEEGIWFYFDHDTDDHETMVLCDSNDNRPRIREDDEGQLRYSDQETAGREAEVAFNLRRHRAMGSTDYVATGYDWTNPGAAVRHERTERGEWRGPPLEVHEHFHNVRHHEYDEGAGRYGSNTAERISRMHTERLDLARGECSLQTSVVGVLPGHTFELVNAGNHDGRYLITRVSASGNPGTPSGGFNATLDIIPHDMPYRPSAPRRPLMPGPETAIVVGPAGEEIHTDRHGRIKVQFHWDRRGERNEHSSVWIRVSQSWAGPGWGTIFIPRIGMEVVVSFLGGDPDRPIVTGCVYNGQNPVPYELPEHKTRSTLKTNSSVGGGGYNELRFEDKKGDEEVWIHAQKDFNEVVEHCHSTHVKVDQSNTVDHDQTETIGNDQTLHVKNNRTKTVDVNEDNTIKGDRTTTIGPDSGNDHLWVMKDRTEQIDINDRLDVVNGDKLTNVVAGKWDITTRGEWKVVQNSINELYMQDCLYGAVIGRVQFKAGDGVHYDAEPGGRLQIKNTEKLLIKSNNDQTYQSGTNIKVSAQQRVAISAQTEIMLQCGASHIKITPSGIEIAGPDIKIEATSGVTDITAMSQVKIKS